MKQPHGPQQTLVWTPDMDPRNKQNSNPTVVPSTPPQGSTPTTRVIRLHQKVVAPIRAAELPPTRLKTTPPTQVVAPPPETSPTKKEKTPPPPANPEKAAAKAAKQQQRQEILKLAADHAIDEEYARFVHSGAWTVDQAQRRHRAKVNHEERLRVREAEEARAAAILRQWVDQGTELARLTHGAPVTAHLLQAETFQWLWDDRPEPQTKLETFAVLSQDDYLRWSSQWQTNLELANQRLQVPLRYSDRKVLALWKFEKAYKERLACQVILFNGLEIEGFVTGLNEYSLEFAQSLEENAPRLFVLRHGIYEFWIFTEPEPVVTEPAATPASAPENNAPVVVSAAEEPVVTESVITAPMVTEPDQGRQSQSDIASVQTKIGAKMAIEVNSIKVTVPIEGSKLPRDILPPPGTPGSSQAIISLQVKAGDVDVELTASLKAKSYRDVLSKVDASPHGAFAVLQGKLSPGGVLTDAGFAVQPIVPKEPKESLSSAGA